MTSNRIFLLVYRQLPATATKYSIVPRNGIVPPAQRENGEGKQRKEERHQIIVEGHFGFPFTLVFFRIS